MSLKVKGLQDVVDQLDRMGKVGDTHGKKALEQAGDHVKKVEIRVVRRTHNRYSEEVGWQELKRYPVKIGKKGGKFVNIGIRANVSAKQKKKEQKDANMGIKRATHWDKIKGLWFNNYGFFHNRTGDYIAGTDWITTAYEESVDEAFKIISDELEKGMGL